MYIISIYISLLKPIFLLQLHLYKMYKKISPNKLSLVIANLKINLTTLFFLFKLFIIYFTNLVINKTFEGNNLEIWGSNTQFVLYGRYHIYLIAFIHYTVIVKMSLALAQDIKMCFLLKKIIVCVCIARLSYT